MKYIDPFLGEIELKEIGRLSKDTFESYRTDIIYTDTQDRFYIDSECTTGKLPMIILSKELIGKICELYQTNK